MLTSIAMLGRIRRVTLLDFTALGTTSRQSVP
jgi:hypothetical protein